MKCAESGWEKGVSWLSREKKLERDIRGVMREKQWGRKKNTNLFHLKTWISLYFLIKADLVLFLIFWNTVEYIFCFVLPFFTLLNKIEDDRQSYVVEIIQHFNHFYSYYFSNCFSSMTEFFLFHEFKASNVINIKYRIMLKKCLSGQ